MSEKSNFKVVIVGGSIAGLTLAHCLNANGIDYAILERRNEIAPQIGASVSLMPNGSRILDQLGLFDEISESIEPCIFMQTWTGEGKLLSETNAPILTSKRLGYTITFLERERLLKILYERLPDKSKVLVGRNVKRIEQNEKEAIVYCEDGSSFTGNVVAGADGVRSGVRTIMRNFIRKEGNHVDLESLSQDENSLSAEYSCLFGISKPINGLKVGHTHRSLTKGASTLLFCGENARLYWFLFVKNSERNFGNEIPRYHKEAEIDLVAKFMDHHISGHVKFSQIWKNRIITNLVPIEEMINNHWVWGRIACLGDSMHKMTPNLGQGANCAIESAAELANHLANFSKVSPSFHEVTQALNSFYQKRHVRANQIVHAANKFTRLEALDSRGDFIASMYIVPRLGDILADRGIKVQIGAAKLNALPMPKRAIEGTMSWSENTGIGKEENPKYRQRLAMPFLFLSIFFWWNSVAVATQASRLSNTIFESGYIRSTSGAISLVRKYLGWPYIDVLISKGVARYMLTWSSAFEQKLESLCGLSYSLAINVLWMIESFRRGNVLTVSHIFPNILLFLSDFRGLGLFAPIYFFFHYTQSPQEKYAALDNRLTNLAFAKTAIPTLLLTFIGPVLATLLKESDLAQWLYGCFGYIPPIRLALFSRILMLCVKDTTSTDRLYKSTADLVYLRFIYFVSGLTCTLCHILAMLYSDDTLVQFVISHARLTWQLLRYGPSNYTDLSSFSFVVTFVAAFFWIFLSFADLKTAGRLNTSWGIIILVFGCLLVICGPGSAVIFMWAWREEVMAKKYLLE